MFTASKKISERILRNAGILLKPDQTHVGSLLVDLSLPSATQWALSDIPGPCTAQDVLENYADSIPTTTQWVELFLECRIKLIRRQRSSSYLAFIGLNGNVLHLDIKRQFLGRAIGFRHYWTRDASSGELLILQYKGYSDIRFVSPEDCKVKKCYIRKIGYE